MNLTHNKKIILIYNLKMNKREIKVLKLMEKILSLNLTIN